VRYSWVPPLAGNDSVAAATVTKTSGTALVQSYEALGDSVVIVVSGGTAGETVVLAAEAFTSEGEVLTETIYLPIISSDAAGETARDICEFALRKLYGAGVTPAAKSMEHALECLEDMLAEWRISGADIGSVSPLSEGAVIYCPRDYMRAVKNNLIVAVADLFGLEIGEMVYERARRGLQHIKQRNLEDRDPATALYY
jgi:hypothetical protein